MSIDLRPLKLGELLDRAFAIYRRHFSVYVGIMAAPMVLAGLAGMWVLFLTPPTQPGEVPDLEQMLPGLVAMLGGTIALLLVYWVVYMMALGATTMAVAEVYDGREPTVGGAYQQVRPRIGRLLLFWLLVALRIGGAFLGVIIVTSLPAVAMLPFRTVIPEGLIPIAFALLLMIGMIGGMLFSGWVAMRYAVGVPVLMLEGVPAGAAVRRSRELTRGSFWRVCVLVLFAMVLSYLSLAIFQGPFIVAAAMAGVETSTGFWLRMAGTASGAVGGMLTAPVLVIGFVVLYYDLRVRKEALDLTTMMGALDTPGGSAGSMAGAARPASELPG